MPEFSPLKYSYASHRNVVYAKKGMTASTSPVASQVGIDVMKAGGNAMDAAIAMAAVLPLVEPTGNGLGSDCFALVWSAKDKKLFGLDGSGYSPKALSAEEVKKAGYTAVPMEGWLSVMVPGAPSAWAELRRRFGTKPMTELLAPAIEYARQGACIPVNVWYQWKAEVTRIGNAAKHDPKLFGPWMEHFTKNGKMFEPGETFYNPDFADTLESLAASDCDSYYQGDIMKKIVAFSKETGGFFEESDFTSYKAQWVDPISVNYKGYDVLEMPPNGHGITALMALKMLEKMDLGADRETAGAYHKMIETTKLAFVDTKKFVADPRYMKTKVADMLSDRYADVRRALISDTEALYPEAGDPSCGGTVYFCTADGEGNMVSFIQSNYNRFGSGILVPGTGITLQDRGANFSMDPTSDNYLEGGKKAYHTIIPGFLAKDGKPIGPFGVMGGFMQPQGHVQVVVNTIDFHMNPQEALDAPRFQWVGEKKVQLEREVNPSIAQRLAQMGHQIEIVNTNIGMGRGEIIWRMDDGTLIGGTEPRADGTIAAW
ncbi:gamma-glutamyltransferase family protein [Vermiculatibacterium agrestimuris]|uniref:gamma-glutamyltransferase family protein n=1 Tax=Vermiculatibacterium agrestimuris TaxID=2941519 RepID=UPI00204248CB|nr:gamma-glutamyltransferase family protein [Vermiculatibacterium agrestimuris]